MASGFVKQLSTAGHAVRITSRDAAKAAAFMIPLIERPVGTVPIRDQLQKFAVEQGLQI